MSRAGLGGAPPVDGRICVRARRDLELVAAIHCGQGAAAGNCRPVYTHRPPVVIRAAPAGNLVTGHETICVSRAEVASVPTADNRAARADLVSCVACGPVLEDEGIHQSTVRGDI